MNIDLPPYHPNLLKTLRLLQKGYKLRVCLDGITPWHTIRNMRRNKRFGNDEFQLRGNDNSWYSFTAAQWSIRLEPA